MWICKKQSKTFICLGPLLHHTFLLRTKKNALLFGNSRCTRKNWINYIFFLWEVLKNFWIFYLIYGYEKTKNGLFLGQQQNSNYDVISTINQSSCHLTICLADWVAISLTSGRLSIKRENESVADHMKKMTFVGKKHFNYHLPSIS